MAETASRGRGVATCRSYCKTNLDGYTHHNPLARVRSRPVVAVFCCSWFIISPQCQPTAIIVDDPIGVQDAPNLIAESVLQVVQFICFVGGYGINPASLCLFIKL